MLCVQSRALSSWDFHSKELFEEHVFGHEGFNLNEAIKRGHVGRNGQRAFWCGFCQVVVPLRTKRNEAWRERFDHIQTHFDSGSDIFSWLCYKDKNFKPRMKSSPTYVAPAGAPEDSGTPQAPPGLTAGAVKG